ncbi:MAG: cytochrome C oxidase Cbb3 [Leptolyngbya sp. PLA2]|nr:cytochrome C oxidase Cbb3 [Leptolyngbya sp.]MCE7970976.1 cytochrome C oxidase Cbb3 [Leptolyngbya sp. PL-A2]MCZ7631953.1 c-type cytochrome [Phycisphaerales bacterium]MDL1905287.1 c-type cytochrome [Synechococcales cyanobacterium CNB]GIK20242.1 MAG: cytochrome CBB3 [Planctomycetota bacterium]
MSHQDRLMEHEYDGIREYDNPTPGWWHAIFIGTVLFSIVYFTFWHFSPMAYTVHEAHQAAVTREFKRLFADLGELTPDQHTLLTVTTDDRWRAVASGVYTANCAQCHGQRGEGLVGPNLTDDHYKWVKRVEDVYGVVANGAAAGAMPAWDKRLSTNEMILVASYVARLRGQNLPGPRGPEGDAIPPWPSIEGSTP